MLSLNARHVAVNVTDVQTTPHRTPDERLQGGRDDTFTVWVHASVLDGSQCLIKGAPDANGLLIGGHDGMILHTIITTGTAGAGQTKVNAQGFAMVVVQALPLIHLRFAQGLNTAVWNGYIVE